MRNKSLILEARDIRLAVELIEHGWSMKHIHRLIVTSQVYRMSSSAAGANPDTLARDPENQFYWRANPIRMEAQLVRDSLLHLAGELDLTRGKLWALGRKGNQLPAERFCAPKICAWAQRELRDYDAD